MKLKNCPVCGKRIDSKCKICPECDSKLIIAHNSKMPRALYIAFAALFLTIILIGITLLGIHKNKISSISNDNISEFADSSEEINENNDTNEPSFIDTNNETTSSAFSYEDLIGVYIGNDNNLLVLNSDGLAYYLYSEDYTYMEIACPWKYENNTIYIELAKMHCTIEANASDLTNLLFKSVDCPKNWNPELFTKIDATPETILSRNIPTYDKNLSVNKDGSFNLTIDDLHFTVPKHYLDYKDAIDSKADMVVLGDGDVTKNFSASLLFQKSDDAEIMKDLDNKISTIIESFITDTNIEYVNAENYANHDFYIYSFSGIANDSFSSVNGYNTTGMIAVVPNKDGKSAVIIIMMQNNNDHYDYSHEFLDILKSCY